MTLLKSITSLSPVLIIHDLVFSYMKRNTFLINPYSYSYVNSLNIYKVIIQGNLATIYYNKSMCRNASYSL